MTTGKQFSLFCNVIIVISSGYKIIYFINIAVIMVISCSRLCLLFFFDLSILQARNFYLREYGLIIFIFHAKCTAIVTTSWKHLVFTCNYIGLIISANYLLELRIRREILQLRDFLKCLLLGLVPHTKLAIGIIAHTIYGVIITVHDAMVTSNSNL